MNLLHVTLTTGHRRWSPRDEVGEELLAQLAPMVIEAERSGQAEILSPTGLMLLRRLAPPAASRHAACWAISEPQGPALVTLALGMRSRQGAGLWRTVHELFSAGVPPLITRADDPPPAPWLAVILHLPMLLPTPHPAVHWLGDAERCIAWAWIDSVWGAP